jgi:hypothetical protein
VSGLLDEEFCPRAGFFAYFFYLQKKGKSFGRDANRKTAWMQVSVSACFISLKRQEHASRHHSARLPPDGFCLEPLRTRYSFSTAKKSIQTKWSGTILNICKMARRAKYKDILCKMPLATKVFNRTKRLVLWAPTALSLQMCSLQLSLKWHPARRPLAICP